MNHHRLHCYSKLMDMARSVPTVLQRMPEGHAYLQDQLKRALSSAILNLAEGNGRRSIKERRRFFDISLASLSEVDAILDLCSAYHLISESEFLHLQSEGRSAYAMIYKLRQI